MKLIQELLLMQKPSSIEQMVDFLATIVLFSGPISVQASYYR